MTCRVQEASVKWTDGKEVWHGWVAGIPEEKKKSRLVPMAIGDRNVLLYVPKDSLSAQVACGDELWFYARIRPPQNREGSTFDYAAYLKRQGVSGTAYAGEASGRRATVTGRPDGSSGRCNAVTSWLIPTAPADSRGMDWLSSRH